MRQIEELIREARLHRDATIHHAKRDFRKTVNELRAIGRRLSAEARQRRQVQYVAPEPLNEDLAGLTVTKAAREVLALLGPLSEVEIVLEVQRRGCRVESDPRAVHDALRKGLRRNHRGWFKRVGEKWGRAKP